MRTGSITSRLTAISQFQAGEPPKANSYWRRPICKVYKCSLCR